MTIAGKADMDWALIRSVLDLEFIKGVETDLDICLMAWFD